ncbi:MAG: hypothetical protein ACI8XM_000378 [Haloarculaceae archaeon]|jgi:hypothetical protein
MVVTVETVVAGLAGGMFGALIGAFPALALAGVVIVVGEMATLVGGTAGGAGIVGPETLHAQGLTGTVGLGPLLGPHVAFAGAVAATAYVGRRHTLDSEFPYHPAKHVTRPLGSAPDVLAVGGVFGVVGVLLVEASVLVGLPVDPLALGIVLSAFLHRIVFGYPLVGRIGGALLDMSPYERGQRRGGLADGDAQTDSDTQADGGRYLVEPWLPEHYEWPHAVAIGVAVGLAAGYLALVTGSPFLAFGLALVTLAFFSLGLDEIPVTHHMALPASIVALAVPEATMNPALALAGAAVFGVLGALAGELAQRTLYAHADTHLDPPAASIVVTSLLITVLASVGLLDPAAVPYPTL